MAMKKEITPNGKKLLMMIAFVLVMFFISGCMYGKAYAYTSDELAISNSSDYAQTHGYSYYYLTKNEGKYWLWMSDSQMYYQSNDNTLRSVDGTSSMKFASSLIGTADTYDLKTTTDVPYIGCGTGFISLSSNNDIYTSSLKTSVFFSQPIKAPILPTQVQPQLLSPAMGEVMAMVPLLIPLLVGFLALRKALATLQGILHQA